MNEFDELYNEFFRDKGNNKNKGGLSEGMKKMLKFVERLNETGSVGNISPEEDEMGPPTTRRVYEEDGVKLEECTWDTEYGTVVRIATIEDVELTEDWFKKNGIPTGEQSGGFTHEEEKEPTLEEKLKIAEKVEDYETCAEIRDEIKALAEEKVAGELKNNKGIPKKDKKDEASENLDNKGFPDKDDWNF
jgi:hypothetical protein